MKKLRRFEFTFVFEGEGVEEREALEAAILSIKAAANTSIEPVEVQEVEDFDNEDLAEAFFHRMGDRITDTQKELMLRCSDLNGAESAHLLGCLNRFMLEPNMNFWDALHKAFEIAEGGVLMPELLN